MLHILWILIKFILIILGILLGLALLAVLLLLFCPVRYQARAVKETGSFKETELEARITWLFHVIGVRFCFHNGEGKLVVLFFGVSLETIKGWLKKLKGGRRKNSVSQTSRSKAKKRKKKSAQTKGISQENRTKKPDVKEASGEESNVSNAVAEEKTQQMAESRIETEKKASQPEAHAAENFQDHAPKTEAVLLENNTAALEQLSSAQSVQNDRLEALEKQIRLQTLVTSKQVYYLNDAIRMRARELLDKRSVSDNKAITKLGNLIRKSVLARYGVSSLRDVPKHEYNVALSQIGMWNDILSVRTVAAQFRNNAEMEADTHNAR